MSYLIQALREHWHREHHKRKQRTISETVELRRQLTQQTCDGIRAMIWAGKYTLDYGGKLRVSQVVTDYREDKEYSAIGDIRKDVIDLFKAEGIRAELANENRSSTDFVFDANEMEKLQ